jgi:protein transport protein SEC13
MASDSKNSNQKVFNLESQHEENINDCQFDFFGTQVASCDSKGYVQVASVKTNGTQEGQPTMFKAH